MSEATRADSAPDTSAYTSSSERPVRFPKAKIRRDMMRDLEICINASFVVPSAVAAGRNRLPPTRSRVKHGKPVANGGGRCARCVKIHKQSRGGYSYTSKYDLR